MNKFEVRNDMTRENGFKFLLEVIPYGEENAISMTELSCILGITPRNVRSLVFKARVSGNIIAGTDEGYFIPVSLEEMQKYYRHAVARIKSCSQAIKPVKERIRREQEKAPYRQIVLPECMDEYYLF